MNQPVVVAQSFSVPADILWRAITERDHMVQWFFEEIPDFKAEEGFETQFTINAGERDFVHQWKILDVVVGKKIVYDWRYADYPGVGIVAFEVSEENGGSRLCVTTDGVESFPQDVAEFSRASCENGWQYLIQGNLKDYLAGSWEDFR